MLEDLAAAAGAPALFGKVPGKGLHHVEDGRGLPLVAGEGGALGQGVGDDDAGVRARAA